MATVEELRALFQESPPKPKTRAPVEKGLPRQFLLQREVEGLSNALIQAASRTAARYVSVDGKAKHLNFLMGRLKLMRERWQEALERTARSEEDGSAPEEWETPAGEGKPPLMRHVREGDAISQKEHQIGPVFNMTRQVQQEWACDLITTDRDVLVAPLDQTVANAHKTLHFYQEAMTSVLFDAYLHSEDPELQVRYQVLRTYWQNNPFFGGKPNAPR